MTTDTESSHISDCNDPKVDPLELVGGLDATSSLPLANIYQFAEFIDIALDICWFLLFLALFTELTKLFRALRYLASKMASNV